MTDDATASGPLPAVPYIKGLAQMIRTSREWRAVSVARFFWAKETPVQVVGVEIRLKRSG